MLPKSSPKKLVRRGLYRYSRNPMYVGVLTVIFGWAVLYQSPAVTVYGLAISLCFYSFVVFFEEPILSKRFGAEYEHALKFLDGYSCDAAGLLNVGRGKCSPTEIDGMVVSG
jgi:Phospholipid methyltransferase